MPSVSLKTIDWWWWGWAFSKWLCKPCTQLPIRPNMSPSALSLWVQRAVITGDSRLQIDDICHQTLASKTRTRPIRQTVNILPERDEERDLCLHDVYMLSQRQGEAGGNISAAEAEQKEKRKKKCWPSEGDNVGLHAWGEERKLYKKETFLSYENIHQHIDHTVLSLRWDQDVQAHLHEFRCHGKVAVSVAQFKIWNLYEV